MCKYMPMRNLTNPIDRIVGEALGVGSRFKGDHAHIGFTHLDSTPPHQAAITWRHARIPADSISNWVSYPGQDESGRLPPNYNEFGVLNIDKQLLQDYLFVHGGRHAVAYALGSTVMVGVTLKTHMFSIERDDDANLQVAMGIGKKVLNATAGILKWDNTFVTGPDLISEGPRMARQELPVSLTQV